MRRKEAQELVEKINEGREGSAQIVETLGHPVHDAEDAGRMYGVLVNTGEGQQQTIWEAEEAHRHVKGSEGKRGDEASPSHEGARGQAPGAPGTGRGQRTP